MVEASPRTHGDRSRLVVGLFLIALGALLLASNLGFDLPDGWWRYLPAIPVVFGAWGIVAPNRNLDRSGGVWLLAIGLYCFAGFFDWFGLGWSGAWPLFVIAAGVSFTLHRREPAAPNAPRDLE